VVGRRAEITTPPTECQREDPRRTDTEATGRHADEVVGGPDSVRGETDIGRHDTPARTSRRSRASCRCASPLDVPRTSVFRRSRAAPASVDFPRVTVPFLRRTSQPPQKPGRIHTKRALTREPSREPSRESPHESPHERALTRALTREPSREPSQEPSREPPRKLDRSEWMCKVSAHADIVGWMRLLVQGRRGSGCERSGPTASARST
jgi:hypothetical protein